MKLSEAITLSSSNIRRHRLRSTLTAIGIAVGVATVIAMMTLGSSFEAYFVNQYNGTFATNAFTIQPKTGDVATQLANAESALYVFPSPVFAERDVAQLSSLDGVRSVIPYSYTWLGGNLKVDGRQLNTTFGVDGMTISPLIFTNGFLRLEAGSTTNSSSQIVVGSLLAQSIAYEVGATNDTAYAVGHRLTINYEGAPKNVTIVGVLKDSPTQWSLNTLVYLPLADAPPSTKPVFNGVVMIADSPQDVLRAEGNALAYLNANSTALGALRSTGQGLSFSASAVTGASSFLSQQVNEYTTIILAMGAVALFGGAVGVSNIMLVSVTERTKEIGMIKAIGGSKKDVVRIFVIEAVLVSLIGVVLGVALGAALGFALTRLPLLGTQLPLVYNYIWFPVSAGIGLATGVAAGVYPALRAAKVPPVTALKYE